MNNVKLWKAEEGGRKHWILESRQPIKTGATVTDLHGLLGDKLEVTGATAFQLRSKHTFDVNPLRSDRGGSKSPAPTGPSRFVTALPAYHYNHYELWSRRQQRGRHRIHTSSQVKTPIHSDKFQQVV